MLGDEVDNPHTFVNTLVYLLWQVFFASKWRRTQKAPFFSIGIYSRTLRRKNKIKVQVFCGIQLFTTNYKLQ